MNILMQMQSRLISTQSHIEEFIRISETSENLKGAAANAKAPFFYEKYWYRNYNYTIYLFLFNVT